MNLSVGKRRGLAETSTANGVFSILALDHRNNLRRALNPENPEVVSAPEISAFKSKLIYELANKGSAVLLDPEFGAFQAVLSDSMPGHVGLVVAVEATGYTGDETARESEILQGWSVGKIRRMGASALKLLVYYHPESILARKQEDLIAAISEACNKYDLLFFLEPLSYSLDTGKMLNSIEKSKVVINTAERLTSIGIDVLKAEFPLNVEEDPDENHWAEACESLSNASRVPWVLLSAAVNFECYLRQLSIACQNGASGAMAGRAVWKEAVGYHGMKLDSFLRVKAGERLQCITDVCNVLGKPWQKFYPPQATVPRNYYKSYPDL